MRIAQEEILGPVGALISFADEEDAVLKANNSGFGLAVVVWTQYVSRANCLARTLKSGSVWVNTLFKLDPIFPSGGYKQSSVGCELGEEAI
jgi:acyl-CoA reductase-like NAD-dependent aldehyde dehydrogenase